MEPERDPSRETTGSPSDERVVGVAAASAGPDEPTLSSARLDREEVARITVEPEDRLAFRVGVNILTLVLVGLAVYLVWRRYFAGG